MFTEASNERSPPLIHYIIFMICMQCEFVPRQKMGFIPPKTFTISSWPMLCEVHMQR